jgi:hypothetical protein
MYNFSSLIKLMSTEVELTPCLYSSSQNLGEALEILSNGEYSLMSSCLHAPDAHDVTLPVQEFHQVSVCKRWDSPETLWPEGGTLHH